MAVKPAPGNGSVHPLGPTSPVSSPTDSSVDRYRRFLARLIHQSLEIHAYPMHALDLACGIGTASIELFDELPAGSRLIAIDNDRNDLREFHARLTPEQGRSLFPRKENRLRLPFAAAMFDVVWAAVPSGRLEPLPGTLRQALRVLRPGGQLLIAAPLRATFAELAKAITPTILPLRGQLTHAEAYSALLSEPSHLLGTDGWLTALQRCGAIETEVIRTTIYQSLDPPLSEQPLFHRYMLPLWVGADLTRQAKALRLLDEALTTPLSFTIHVGCVMARRGLVKHDAG